MSSNTISYVTLLKNLKDKEKILAEKHNIIIPEVSWYSEAISILKKLILAIKKGENLRNKDNDDNYWNRIFTSFALLEELSGILVILDLIDKENLKIFISKLKLIFKGPLLMCDENSTNNLGRNILFELSLFSWLIKNGYKARLYYDHPDISFQVQVREYVIECKRIYKPKTLIKNTKAAIHQLLEYSLNKPKPEGIKARYGIVAISLSRYIHKGDKLFDAISQEKAKERINYEMKKIFDDNKEELLRPFPINVPALLLKYSDRGTIDMPYTYNFIDVHETANGRYSRFELLMEDIEKLKD